MTTAGWSAVALAAVGLAAILLVLVHRHVVHTQRQPFPTWAHLALIGGWLALMGALCFAIAFMLGG
jgi:hypothetical protein